MELNFNQNNQIFEILELSDKLYPKFVNSDNLFSDVRYSPDIKSSFNHFMDSLFLKQHSKISYNLNPFSSPIIYETLLYISPELFIDNKLIIPSTDLETTIINNISDQVKLRFNILDENDKLGVKIPEELRSNKNYSLNDIGFYTLNL